MSDFFFIMREFYVENTYPKTQTPTPAPPLPSQIWVNQTPQKICLENACRHPLPLLPQIKSKINNL